MGNLEMEPLPEPGHPGTLITCSSSQGVSGRKSLLFKLLKNFVMAAEQMKMPVRELYTLRRAVCHCLMGVVPAEINNAVQPLGGRFFCGCQGFA